MSDAAGRARLRLVREGEPPPDQGDLPSGPANGDGPPGPPGPPRRDPLRALFGLAGQVAVVIGGGAVGRAIAAGLADAGARVAVADVDLEAAKAAARGAARPRVAGALAVRLDVTDAARVRSAITAIEQMTGRIDILVNAAWPDLTAPTEAGFDPAAWRRLLDIAPGGAWAVTEAVGQGMIARGHGRILTVARLGGEPGDLGLAAAAATGAIERLTRAVAADWEPLGVAVNALLVGDLARIGFPAPGQPAGDAAPEPPTGPVPAPVAGDGHADGGRPPVVVAPASGVAAPNVPAVGAGPADVVGAALFLSSPAARLVTGQVIAVGLPVD